MGNTIYDSVYRTLLNDCTPLIIPVINEVFGEHYSMDESVQLYPNEALITSPEGELLTRITDSNFVIIGKEPRRYHIECESSEKDHTMMVRMYEYDTQIALMDAVQRGDTLYVRLPKSAIIYLRHNSKTPDEMKMVIEADNERLVRRLPTVKIQRYSIEEIFEKELYYFLPFHIFVHEKELSLYNKDEKKLEVLVNEYKEISHRLVVLWRQGKMDERTLDCIVNGMKQVLNKIAHKYQRIVKEGERAMGGEILDYPAKASYREGMKKGREDGIMIGRDAGIQEHSIQVYKNCIERGMSKEDALAISELNEKSVPTE